MSEIKWWKLEDGSFGVSGAGNSPLIGQVVEVLSKSGKRAKVTIKEIVHSDDRYWRASVDRDGNGGGGSSRGGTSLALCPHCGREITLS